MVFPVGIWIIFAVSLVCCSMGLYRFLWFLTVGYGLSVAGIGAALLIWALAAGEAGPLFLFQCLLFLIYGIRLSSFVLIRELKNEKYRAKLAEAGGETKVPLVVGLVMWVMCGALYVAQTAALVYRFFNGKANSVDAALIAGILITAAGILIEAVADQQKSEEKKLHSDLPAMHGLYRLCRCPNYFGEMLVWIGCFISGVMVYQGAQWVVAVVGYAAIMYIMLSGAKRVEARHIRYYGHMKEYNEYADHTPLIIPFVPLYHMTSPEKMAREDAARKAKKEKKNAK